MFVQILVITLISLAVIFNPVIGPLFIKFTNNVYKSLAHFLRSTGAYLAVINFSWLIAELAFAAFGSALALPFKMVEILIVFVVSLAVALISNRFIKE